MNAASSEVVSWLADPFWDRFQQLESRHQRIHTEYENLRRRVDALAVAPDDELRDVWDRYCQVLADLDKTSEEIATLHPNIA